MSMPTKGTIRRLLRLARPWRRWMWGSVAIACITVLASVALMAVAGWFIAAMAIAGVTTGMMNYFVPAAGIRFFAIVRTGGRYIDRLVSHEATFRLLTGLRLWLVRKLAPLAPAQLEDRRGADLAAGLQTDVDTLQHAYLRLASPVAVAILCGIAVVVLFLILYPPAALVVGALLISAGGIVPALIRRAAAGPGAEVVRRRAALRVAVVDALQGAVDLRAAGAMPRTVARLDADGTGLVEAQRRVASLGAVAEAAVALCAGLALWGVALLAAGGVAAGQIAPPLLPALALAALAAFEAVAPMPAAMQRLGEVRAAAGRLFALSDREPAIPDGGPPSPEPLDGSLDLSGVVLRYAPDAPRALDGLDLRIADGETVAILGPSGAGKSSIARLLLRFWDYDGEICLGGHDLRAYRPEDARRLVAVADQGAHLFNATLRDNLLVAAPDADEAAMQRALAVACLDDFVASLPDGFDTWIGEGGRSLSAGQARRLVVARAVLRDPLVLLLDEPTENLDATTAQAMLASIAEARRGRTTLLITHDPAAAEGFADRLVHLRDGRVRAA